ncbi:UBX domain-containing protein 4 [Drosophila nasuta]|uniref:UBX domain-containing protein 4 n=1 Tax=Drosophila nasuta TaxID=42062 RepID=UPI00295E9F60|nr:UBX domain-containing protein 4 [Drosophila nasuta]
MNWHTGNIAEAVAESKAKDAIFVVYIEGQDEMSAKLDRFLGDSRVSSKLMTSDFVAVKIQGDSPTYAQFIALYKVVPVPSIFFIGNSGTPLDVTTGIIESVEELVAKIDKVLLLAGKQTNQEASTSSQIETPAAELERSIAGEEKKKQAQQEQQSEQEEQTEQATEESASEEGSSEAPAPEPIETPELSSDAADEPIQPVIAPEPTSTSSTAAAAAEKRAASAAATAVASLMPVSVPLVPPQADNGSTRSLTQEPVDIQQLVEQKRAERQKEQRRREKDNELRRRREGRESQVHQQQAREQELKNMQERLRREKQEEQAARERIKAQIAADRAEQANRVEAQNVNTQSNSTNTASSAPAESTQSNSSSSDETRLQIRLPGGITRTKAFPSAEPLATVRVYVTNELLAGNSNVRNFSLATSYPRREFQTEDEIKSLLELNLVPNAVLLVLQREQVNSVVRTSNNLFSILSSVLWAILTPATMAFDYLNKIGLQRIRQRFVQMVSNVGFKTPGRAVDNDVAAAQDASARRNMGMFTLQSRPRSPPPASTADDATSTYSTDPQYEPPNMFFSQGASSQQNSQRAGGGASSSSSSNANSGGSFRRYGGSNIRRLADTKDDDDEKATYNGNSTQQQ